MLEIVFLVVLWRAMGSLRRAKRRPALGFQILAILAWLGGEFAVGFVAGVAHARRHGAAPFEMEMSIYLFSVLGAACGAGLVFLIAALLPAAEPQPDLSLDAAGPLTIDPNLDPTNPYNSPRS